MKQPLQMSGRKAVYAWQSAVVKVAPKGPSRPAWLRGEPYLAISPTKGLFRDFQRGSGDLGPLGRKDFFGKLAAIGSDGAA